MHYMDSMHSSLHRSMNDKHGKRFLLDNLLTVSNIISRTFCRMQSEECEPMTADVKNHICA